MIPINGRGLCWWNKFNLVKTYPPFKLLLQVRSSNLKGGISFTRNLKVNVFVLAGRT